MREAGPFPEYQMAAIDTALVRASNTAGGSAPQRVWRGYVVRLRATGERTTGVSLRTQRPARSRCVGAIGVSLAAGLVLATAAAAATATVTPAEFIVNSIDDAVDASPGDGHCETVVGNQICTLRAAVMEANKASGIGATITLPAGTYKFIIPANPDDGDSDKNGDLNLTAPVIPSDLTVITINGAGAATTIIDAQQKDRVFNVAAGRTAQIHGVSMINGLAVGGNGGGIYSAGHLTLSDCTLNDNSTIGVGGGIFNANTGVLTLIGCALNHNAASSDGGGIDNLNHLTMTDCVLDSNTTTGTDSLGGGISNEGAYLELTDSTLSNNTAAKGNGGGIWNGGFQMVATRVTLVGNKAIDAGNGGGRGGGIYSGGPYLEISESILGANVAALGAGIYAANSSLVVDGSMIIDNIAAQSGGGIWIQGGAASISLTTISGNKAAASGGGIWWGGGLQGGLDYSTVSNNSAGASGGGIYADVQTKPTIVRSTFSGNSAPYGGGIYNAGQLALGNSTVAQNHAVISGGGIYNSGDTGNSSNVYNATIAFNQADSDTDGSGTGGGVFIELAGIFNIRNTVIAANTRALPTTNDDCSGDLGEYGKNRLGTMAGCTKATRSSGTASVALAAGELGPLAPNGGPTQTIALLAGSSMIDGADTTKGCIDQNGALVTTDERGFARSVGVWCDIGAFEYDDYIFADGFD